MSSLISTLTLKVVMGEEVDSHPVYLVKLTAPAANKSWTVGYRFRNFKDFYSALASSDLEAIKSSFPESKLKSKFGLLGFTLSQDEFNERCGKLESWLSEMVLKRNNLSKQSKELLTSFLNLNNLKDAELDSMVVAQPTREVDKASTAASTKAVPSAEVIKLLFQGHPLIQHKIGSKLGALTSRPLILRLSEDKTTLALIEAVEGVGFIGKKTLLLNTVSEVFEGNLTPIMEKALSSASARSIRRGASFAATPPGTVVERECRCFSLVSEEVTWDLELSPLFIDVLGGNTSLRDQITTCLRQLCPLANSDDFIPSGKFTGRKRGFVFKLGPEGVGYYRDSPRR